MKCFCALFFFFFFQAEDGIRDVAVTGVQTCALPILEDVRTALAAANVDQAKGVLDGPRQSFTIGANDQLTSSKQYNQVVIAYRNGAPVRLSDIATAVDSAENVKQAAWMNTTPAVIMNIQRQPGANIISVADRIKALDCNCGSNALILSALPIELRHCFRSCSPLCPQQ